MTRVGIYSTVVSQRALRESNGPLATCELPDPDTAVRAPSKWIPLIEWPLAEGLSERHGCVEHTLLGPARHGTQ